MKNQINTANAPGAIGPYSQAIDTGSMVFASGQLPIDPATGAMPADITMQNAPVANQCKSHIGISRTKHGQCC